MFCGRCRCIRSQPSGGEENQPNGDERHSSEDELHTHRRSTMNRHVSGALRVVRSAFRGGNDEESFQFARFRDDLPTNESTEMSTIPNGDAASHKNSCNDKKVDTRILHWPHVYSANICECIKTHSPSRENGLPVNVEIQLHFSEMFSQHRPICKSPIQLQEAVQIVH